MRRKHVLLWPVPAILAVACSNTVVVGAGGAHSTGSVGSTMSTATTTTKATSTSAGGGPPIGAHPPPPPAGAPPGDSSQPVIMAVTKLYIGTTDRNGAPSVTAWEQYGFNLDNQITTNDFSMHCKPNAGAAPQNAFPDGADGRDNAFGKSILPVLVSAAGSTDLQAAENQSISAGKMTILVDLPSLGQSANYNPVPSFVMLGENAMGSSWLVVPDTLSGSTPTSAKAAFPAAYVTSNTWATTGDATVLVPLFVLGARLDLNIHHAVLSADLAAGHQTATNGTIAGILDTEEFVAEMKKIIGSFQPSLCNGPTLDSILNQMRQMSDILATGGQDPSQVCNGISIGLGFEAAEATAGGVGPALPPNPDPCAGGG